MAKDSGDVLHYFFSIAIEGQTNLECVCDTNITKNLRLNAIAWTHQQINAHIEQLKTRKPTKSEQKFSQNKNGIN